MAELSEIIEGCKRNKRKYQDMLYAQYSSMLFGICLRYTKSRFEAEDIMQEGWVKIFKHIGTYSMDRSFEAWMRRIMINTAITNYRKNLKHAYHEDVADSEVSGGMFHATDPNNLEYTAGELRQTIEKLPEGYKMVFNLYVVEGYKHKEIAEMLSIDINTSKSQLSRAKKYLQRELQQLSEITL